MDEPVRITIEVDPTDYDALSVIAADSGVSLNEVATEALRNRIDREQDVIEAVRAGLDDIAAGRVVSDEDYLAHAAERRRRWLADRQQ